MTEKKHHTQTVFKRQHLLPIAVAVFLALYIGISYMPALSSRISDLVAHGFVSYCSRSTDRMACYEEHVPLLLRVSSLDSVFSVIRSIQHEDRSYQFCHVLAHKLGTYEVERNPDGWVDALHKNPSDGLCSNGYIHGVIVGKFNKSELTTQQINAIEPDLARACEPTPDWHPSQLDEAICYHGMGHVLTHITGANLPLAVSYCHQIALKGDGRDFRQTCVSGVFMQIFQPLEPEDYALIERLPVKPTKQTLASFCGSYTTQEERSLCFGEGWPLFREELKTAAGAQAFCTTSSDEATQKDCYSTVFAIGARGSLGQPEKQSAVCAALPENLARQCFGVLATAFIEEDRTQGPAASALCMHAPAAYTNSCFEYLVQRTDFMFGNDIQSKQRFCASVPESFSGRCMGAGPRQTP